MNDFVNFEREKIIFLPETDAILRGFRIYHIKTDAHISINSSFYNYIRKIII
jgi:hypothetical protein